MTIPLQQAQQDWENKTIPHPKQHFNKNGKKQEGLQDFRKYEQAIALINWEGEYIEITKMEKLPEAGRGAAIPLVNFLKTLADKYQLRIRGLVNPYIPDPPRPDEPPITQEQLEAWYEKCGFQLLAQGKPAPTWIWYPDIDPIYLDDSPSSLPAC